MSTASTLSPWVRTVAVASCERFLNLALLTCVAGLVFGCAQTQKQGLREPTSGDIRQLRYRLAESLVAQRSYEQAGPLVRDLLRQDGDNPRLHLLLGIVLREKGVLGGAENAFRRAEGLAPQDPEVQDAWGILRVKQKRLVAAVARHQKAVSLAPKVARYHNDLGVALLAQRKLPEARQAFETAIALDPGMRRAYNNLGFARGLDDDLDGARQAFAQAGSEALTLTNLGYLEQLRGKPNAARRYYEKALRVQQGFPPALNNLRALDPGRWPEPPPEGVVVEPPQAKPTTGTKAVPATGGKTVVAPTQGAK